MNGWRTGLAILLLMGSSNVLPQTSPEPAQPAASAPAAAAAAEAAASAASAPDAAASAPEPPAPPPSCAVLSSRAMSADLRATTAQTQNKELDLVAQLLDESIKQWQLAVTNCEGHARERAERNLVDNQKSRADIAERQASGSQCEASHRDATSLQELALAAFGDRRWPDAAMLYRKAETMWDLAAENCSGAQQQVALKHREQAAIDGHNAEFCAPLFDRSREYTQKFRAASAGLALADRQQQSQIAETLWRDTAKQCRGSAQELATGNAQALARERGTPWVATAAPPPPGTVAAPVVPKPGAVAAATPAPAAAQLTAKTGKAVVPVPVPVPGPVPVPVTTPVAVAASPHPSPPATVAEVQPADPKELDVVAGNTHYKGQFVREDGHVISGTGRVEWANGDVYIGPLLHNERQGQGELTWANGQRYKGTWVHDRAIGQGQVVFANGDRYDGEVVDGVPEGEGVQHYASGDVYTGQLKQGVSDGHGTYQWVNGQRFEGDWVQGKPQGKGQLRFANGNLYEGPVVAGEPHGRGRMVFPSGDIYEGSFEHGIVQGHGQYIWKSGDVYEGPWVKGRKHGMGKFYWANGDSWQGEFKDDERTENGVLTRHDDK